MQALIEKFSTYLSDERNLSPHTRSAYLRDLGEFRSFLERHGGSEQAALAKVDSLMLRRYLAELHKRNQRTSIARKLSALRTFFRYLVREGSLPSNPAEGLSTPKLNRYLPKTLSVDEATALMERGYGNSLLDLRDRAIVELFYSSGLRVSELVKLQIGHIDGERRLLRVEQGKGAKDRAVILSPTLLQLLREYWRLLRLPQWLFPGSDVMSPLSVASAQKIFQKAKQQAGIQKIGGIHSLRHAYATHQLEDGLPIHQLQRLLGHQNIQSTLRYAHWVPGYQEGKTGGDLLAKLKLSS